MKKSLVSALTTALVVGAASTTFANPFADVAADHWAYDAIAQLAADGVIEGYGDGTYRGDQEITRYEVAQIVARAMAKDGISAANKATLDKLAAEFAEELNNLGVRVAALEKKVDNVKWNGQLRYRAGRRLNDAYINKKGEAVKSNHDTKGELMFRLEPTAQVNKHWTVKSRIDAYGDAQSAKPNGKTAANGSKVSVDRAWAIGDKFTKHNAVKVQLGKLPFKTAADQGMVLTYRATGAMVTAGNKLKVDLFAGRLNTSDAKAFGAGTTEGTDLLAAQVYGNVGKLSAGAGYVALDKFGDNDKSKIWNVGLGYKFNKNIALNGAYAHNSIDDVKDSSQKKAWQIEALYKGMNRAQKGSYGVVAAYRHLGQYGTIHSQENETNWQVTNGDKFWEIGFDYCLDKNITLMARYADGEKIDSKAGKDFRAYLAEVNFYF